MTDVLNKFFDTPDEPLRLEGPDNPSPPRVIEATAISDDVKLVREKLGMAIKESAQRVPDLLDLAMQMQEPEMIDSASKMLTALSKLSTDLINIDLRVLQESKKQPNTPVTPLSGEGEVEEKAVSNATTAEVLKMIRAAQSDMDVVEAMKEAHADPVTST